jgi:hypothetical protein
MWAAEGVDFLNPLCRRTFRVSIFLDGQENFRLTLTKTFSRVSGVSIAKAMRMTWDIEYDNGRRRYGGGKDALAMRLWG